MKSVEMNELSKINRINEGNEWIHVRTERMKGRMNEKNERKA